jgi:membrane protein YqaA with SNARE-associated domain
MIEAEIAIVIGTVLGSIIAWYMAEWLSTRRRKKRK